MVMPPLRQTLLQTWRRGGRATKRTSSVYVLEFRPIFDHCENHRTWFSRTVRIQAHFGSVSEVIISSW